MRDTKHTTLYRGGAEKTTPAICNPEMTINNTTRALAGSRDDNGGVGGHYNEVCTRENWSNTRACSLSHSSERVSVCCPMHA